jgi:hypothetical protein
MMMSILSMMAYLSTGALATGRDPIPTGNDHPIVAPYGLFRAADGHIAVAPSTDVFVARFLKEIGLGHLLSDPRFAENTARVQNRAELNRLVDGALEGRTQAHWIERLNRAGVPCGKVQTVTEALADPQVAAQEMVLEVPHPGHGTVRMTGFPVKFSATPLSVRHPVPDLGAQTDEVLAEAGYDAARIAALRQDGRDRLSARQNAVIRRVVSGSRKQATVASVSRSRAVRIAPCVAWFNTRFIARTERGGSTARRSATAPASALSSASGTTFHATPQAASSAAV